MRDPVCVPPLTETVLIPGTSLLCPGQNDSLSEGRTRRGGERKGEGHRAGSERPDEAHRRLFPTLILLPMFKTRAQKFPTIFQMPDSFLKKNKTKNKP